LVLRGRKRRRFFALLLVAGACCLALYLPSVLQQNYALRFPFQSIWPIVLAGVLAVDRVRMKEVAVVLAVAASMYVIVSPSEMRDLADYYPRATSAMLPLGNALRTATDGPGNLVMGDAGQVPYLSGWTLFDTQFLGTPASFGYRGIAGVIADDRRVVLALYSSGPALSQLDATEVGYATVARRAGYEFVGAIAWRPDYWYQIWVSPHLLKDHTLMNALSHVIRQSQAENLRRPLWPDITHWYWFAK
jgi:hypothetical protein